MSEGSDRLDVLTRSLEEINRLATEMSALYMPSQTASEVFWRPGLTGSLTELYWLSETTTQARTGPC
jgi:hypothetical protein